MGGILDVSSIKARRLVAPSPLSELYKDKHTHTKYAFVAMS